MTKSMSGRTNRDPVLADIQRAFAAGHNRERKDRPSKLATLPVADLYTMVSELTRGERRRLLARLAPGALKTGRLLKMAR